MARETCLMLLVFSEFRSGNERSLSGRFVPGNETHWRNDGVAAASSDGGAPLVVGTPNSCRVLSD